MNKITFRLGERVSVTDGALSFTGVYVGTVAGLPRVKMESGDVLTGSMDCIESLEPRDEVNSDPDQEESDPDAVNSDPDSPPDPELGPDDLLTIPQFLKRDRNARGKSTGARGRTAPMPPTAPPLGRAWADASAWEINVWNDPIRLPSGQRKALALIGRKWVRVWSSGDHVRIKRSVWEGLAKRPWVEVGNVVIICLTAFEESLCWRWAGGPVEVATARRTDSGGRGECGVGRGTSQDDRLPSVVVWPGIGKFRCYGCGEHGDVIDLLQKAGGNA